MSKTVVTGLINLC